MATCNNQLRAEGAKSVPRTCSRCGFSGKCTHPDYADNRVNGYTPSLKNIAGLIQKLSYRDMQKFGELIVRQSGHLDEATLKSDAAEVMDALLKTADEILTEKLL